jgi:glycosyltransferase involved in cell wall biosynthesis
VHVLLIHQAFSGPTDPGGTRHYELGSRFVARGHRLTVITSPYNYLTGGRREPGSVDGIDVKPAPTFSGLHRGYLWRVAVFLSFAVTSSVAGLVADDVDLVLGTSPPIFQAVSAWLVAAIRRRPFVLEVRDLWPDFAIELGVLRNRVLIDFARRLEGFLYRRACHIIVNSPAYSEYLVGKGVPESKISVIPNGVDASAFNSEGNGAGFRDAHALNEKFLVMYTGAIGLANDIDCLLRAAGRLRDQTDIVLTIVGGGKELERLRGEAASMHLENVRFIPAQPKHDMPQLLAAADVCVATLKDVPMLRTTYPNKVFDYMAAGRPIVLAIDGVIRQVVESAEAGMFVLPGDDHAIADAILKLHDAPDLRWQMGRNGRRYVDRHFSRDAQAEQFVDLLERICGHS